ncbi:MAG: arginine N-succinyltransferase [Bdellovibrio sp.]|nr:MAG: arginine N-succinyltransferase [Bdellovibrio sp.]
MSFILRGTRIEDLPQLVDLARQFVLLNLPADRRVIGRKIERSLASFGGQVPREEAEYFFVLEDTEEKLVVGSSMIMAKHGTPKLPHSFYKIIEKSHVSQDLGVGFIHKVLRFSQETDGPTEIGGLLVDKLYRKRPERLGKQISLVRFVYMALFPDQFEKRVLCELTPPLTEEGRSEFWEALGRRFTGLPYQEADLLSQNNKEFITSLFPEGDIYLCLLDARARLVLGRVGEQTKPAQYLLESIGFRYLEEVDPFDGGPHFGAPMSQILPIKQGRRMVVRETHDAVYNQHGLLGFVDDDGEFMAALVSYGNLGENEIAVAPMAQQTLRLEAGQSVFVTPFDYPRGRKEQV